MAKELAVKRQAAKETEPTGAGSKGQQQGGEEQK